MMHLISKSIFIQRQLDDKLENSIQGNNNNKYKKYKLLPNWECGVLIKLPEKNCRKSETHLQIKK